MSCVAGLLRFILSVINVWSAVPPTAKTVAFNKQKRLEKETQKIAYAGRWQMSDKIDMHKVKELKEMLQEKKPNEPVEKILAVFCERHSISLSTCRVFYKEMVEKGEIKET